MQASTSDVADDFTTVETCIIGGEENHLVVANGHLQKLRKIEGERRTRLRLDKLPSPIPVVIIDKSALYRAGLSSFLAAGRFRIAASCGDIDEVLEKSFRKGRCLALISAHDQPEAPLPDVASLVERGFRVVILGEQLCAETMLAAIEAGADGYLLKNEIGPDALQKSLELVWLGGVVLPQGIAKLLKRSATVDAVPHIDEPEMISAVDLPRSADEAEPHELARLSNRERMILRHLTQGSSNKHIARELNIAETTVKVHVKSLLRKIRVNNRTQAAMWAVANSLAMPLSSIGLTFLQYGPLRWVMHLAAIHVGLATLEFPAIG